MYVLSISSLSEVKMVLPLGLTQSLNAENRFLLIIPIVRLFQTFSPHPFCPSNHFFSARVFFGRTIVVNRLLSTISCTYRHDAHVPTASDASARPLRTRTRTHGGTEIPSTQGSLRSHRATGKGTDPRGGTTRKYGIRFPRGELRFQGNRLRKRA